MDSSRFDRKQRKKTRVRSRMQGTHEIPRISVFRSNVSIYAQAIDDAKRITIASAVSRDIRSKKEDERMKKADEAKAVGKELAAKLIKKGIKKGVFDRGPYVYLGRVRALAEGLREGGLEV